AGKKQHIPWSSRGAAIGQVLGEDGSLLDAEHVACLITRFRQIEDRDAEPALEAREDTTAEKRDRIIKPGIPLCEDLQRDERSLVFRGWFSTVCLEALRPRPPGAAPFHDLHRGLVL